MNPFEVKFDMWNRLKLHSICEIVWSYIRYMNSFEVTFDVWTRLKLTFDIWTRLKLPSIYDLLWSYIRYMNSFEVTFDMWTRLKLPSILNSFEVTFDIWTRLKLHSIYELVCAIRMHFVVYFLCLRRGIVKCRESYLDLLPRPSQWDADRSAQALV
jgi:hypothetical protein